MTILFVLVNCLKFLFLVLFLALNLTSNTSSGWAFQHSPFIMGFLFIFLPLSFFEKSMLTSKSVLQIFVYIPLFLVFFNWIPIAFGKWITKVFIITQVVSIALTVFVVVLYFRPTIGKTIVE